VVWILDPYELNWQVIGRAEVFPPGLPAVDAEDRALVEPWLPRRFAKQVTLPARPVAVYPAHTTRRISTQRSCFTIHGTDPAGLDRLHARGNGCLEKVLIPGTKVRSIRKDLETCGIDETTVFPDLDGLSRTVSARWLV
jgi:hypothetical protein